MKRSITLSSDDNTFIRRARRLRQSVSGAWLAALLLVAVPFVATNVLIKLFGDPGLRDVNNLIKVAVLVVAYWLYVYWWERRPAYELSCSGAVSESAAGLAIGAVLFCMVIAVLASCGAYSVVAVGGVRELASVVVSMLPKMMAGAVIEELVFRLLILRLLARSLGSVWALLISSALFGLAHIGNVGASQWIAVMLGIELGLLFGAAYILTGRLWLCTSLHLAWNFTQGAVFSIAVSGQTGDGWIRGNLTGPDWLTGGAFGAEGSVVSLVLCLVATTILLKHAHHKGQFANRMS
jgi:uncharacterized protein